MCAALRFDEVGVWSEVKLAIIRDYAAAYSTILNKRKELSHVYIDGFAGAGEHLSKATNAMVPGSPVNALQVEPPFEEIFLVDLDDSRAAHLRELAGDDERVKVVHGDCNRVLLEEVFPRVRYEDYRRGLCVLDPYGLHLNWEVIQTAAQMKSIEIFLNFPVMDMNMNALWKNPENVPEHGVERMTAFWGDESWRDAAYAESPQLSLLGDPEMVKQTNDDVAEAFRERLRKKALFAFVPKPLAMRNTRGATVYYLFFASQNETGGKIVRDIFKRYRSV